MRPTPALLHQFDEAYATAIGRRMLEGSFLPYVDGVSHRGPLFYASVALAVRVFGNGTWLPVRALSLLAIAATLAFGFWAAWGARRSVAGAVMMLVSAGALCVAMPLDDGLGYNSEQPLSALAMASLTCLVFALGSRAASRRVAWAALSGVALSASGLCKQTGFALLLPFGLWIACAAIAAPELSPRERRAIPSAFALGVTLPVLALVVRYAAAGELSTLFYYFVTYNTRVYLAAFAGSEGLREPADALRSHFYVFLALAPLVLALVLTPFSGVTRLRELPRAYADNGFDTTVGLAALITPFVANASLRDLDHYYVQVVPFAGFALGIAVERVLGESTPSRRALIARCAALLPLIAVVELGWRHRAQSFRQDPGVQERFVTHDSAICRFLEKNTDPTDTLFVWGFFPAPYTACNRRPASRYVYTTFVSGYVPHVHDSPANDAARAAPGSHAILEAELAKARPGAIIDVPLTLGLRSLWADDFLRKLVESDYCELPDLKALGMRAWVRRGHPACPAR